MLRKSLGWIRTPRSIAAAALGCVLALTALQADAQGASPAAQQIKYRQSLMTVLGATFGQLGAMVSGKVPFDAQRAATLADRAGYLAQMSGEAFPETSKEGAKTAAKPEIWANRAEFDKLVKDMQAKAAELAKVGKSGSLDQIKPAFGATGQACKACHDKFKAE